MAQRHRKAIAALEVIRMKIAFQKYSLDYVTPWFKSLQKSLISLSIQRKLHVVFRAQSVWASAFASLACPEKSLCSFLSKSSVHASSCNRIIAQAVPSNGNTTKRGSKTGWDEWQETQVTVSDEKDSCENMNYR